MRRSVGSDGTLDHMGSGIPPEVPPESHGTSWEFMRSGDE